MEKTTYDIPQRITALPKRDIENDAPGPISRLELRFEGGTSTFSLPALADLNADQAEALAEQLRNIANIQETHTVLSRRATHHPHKHGLVAMQLPAGHVGPNAVSVSEAAGGRQSNFYWNRHNLVSPEIDFELLPEELHAEAYGWFAPNASPTVFGTLYLVPTGLLEETYATRGHISDFGWSLAQVGIEEPIETVAWDDETAIARLCARALSDDVETVTTMRALTDSAAVAEGLKRHQYRQALRDARSAFVNTTLRPRLVPQVVSDTLRAHSLTEKQAYWCRDEANVFGLVKLDDFAVFGWSNQPKPLAAGYHVCFEDRPTKAAFIAFATALQEALTAKKLGTVAVIPGRYEGLWITRDVALLNQYGIAFGLPEGAQSIPVSQWMEAGAPARA